MKLIKFAGFLLNFKKLFNK